MFNTLAKAKLVFNKKLKTYKLVCAFNVYETNDEGAYKFPPQKKCDYVSGDLQQEDVLNALHNAQKTLHTDNIVLVN